jgi:probable DNA metabolism protein
MSDGKSLIYVYDGSFDGLLSAIYDAYFRREFPSHISDNPHMQQSLLHEYLIISTEEEKAAHVSRIIEEKVSFRALRNIYYMYLSNRDDKADRILSYIRAGLRYGNSVDAHILDDAVVQAQKLAKLVGNEAYLYTEFIRFSELEHNIFYSDIEPVHDVLPLVAPHFAHRFSNMLWLIHDVARKTCVIHDKNGCHFADSAVIPSLSYSKEEMDYRKMWKEFYDTIAIEERKNEKCRVNHMPKRFWRHMTEMR